MNSWRNKISRLRTLLWREFVELRRDRFTLAIMLLIPALQMTLLAISPSLLCVTWKTSIRFLVASIVAPR